MNPPPAIALVGDLHSNSPFGLMPPSFTLDEGNVIMANSAQRWLWACWQDFWRYADERFELEGIIVNGDVPNGINNRDAQTLSVNEADQIKFGVAVLQPAVAVVQKHAAERYIPIAVNRGTGFHSGHAGWREELIAQLIGAERSETGQYTSWYVWKEWRDKIIYATHHISTAVVYPYTPLARAQNNARAKVADGWPMPDADVRSHVHRMSAIEDNSNHWTATAPAWQLPTEFVHKVAASSVPDIGGLVLWLDPDGMLQIKRRLYPIPPPKPRPFGASASRSSSQPSSGSTEKTTPDFPLLSSPSGPGDPGTGSTNG